MGIFKSNSNSSHKSKPSENPYFTTRRKWNDLIAQLNSSVRMWQMLAILSLLGCIGSLVVILIVSMQTKFVPYIVEVDRLGQAIAVSSAQRANQLDERIIHAQLASFISDSRMVTPDALYQKKAILNVYAFLSPEDIALQKMNQWYSATDESTPFKRAEKYTVSVNILSIVPQTPETWQIDWVETVLDRSGKVIERFTMRAIVIIYIVPPEQTLNVEQIRMNPTGLYISDFNWGKLTQ